MKGWTVISVVFTFSVFFSSCLKQEVFPPEPEIKFKSLEVKDGRGALTIEFTDGDGNIGLSQGDTLAPYCPNSCIYHWNLFCEYYEKENGEWVHIPLDPFNNQVPFYYRTPEVTPSGQNKSLQGEIEIEMVDYYLTSNRDTFRFEIELVDRALNHSNVVVTPSFVKP